MKQILAPVILLVLSACAAAPTNSYSLGSGIASYDELKRATEECNSRGGRIVPKDVGGDPADLSNYTCVIGKGN